MIILTRLGGHELALNPDLIERAEPTPDTVITMVDGHKLIVSESIPEVVERVRAWRAGVVAGALRLARGDLPFTAQDAADLACAEAALPAAPAREARVIRLQPRED